MDQKTAQLINEMTADFYRRHAASFSQTRQDAWPGWHQVAACAQDWGFSWNDAHVLDLACGNGRFERFLAQSFPQANMRCEAVDNCAALSAELPPNSANLQIEWVECDVTGALAQGNLPAALPEAPFDCVVCFGFFHHVPSRDARFRLLQALVGAVKPGGVVAVSLWRFMENAMMAQKARDLQDSALTLACGRYGLDPGQLEDGDYLLGWQGGIDALRYCHSFSDDEVAALAESVQGKVRDTVRFTADGRGGDLNSYLVFHI